MDQAMNHESAPTRLDCFRVCEVSDGHFFASEIFKVKLDGELPDYGRHVVALYKHGLQLVPLGYLNILRHDSVALVGGGCVYGKAFAHVQTEHSEAIRANGGVLYCMLKYVFTMMADDYQAFFGYCGDKRAEEVDLKAGFKPTKYPYLLANFHTHMVNQDKDKLIEKIYALGGF